MRQPIQPNLDLGLAEREAHAVFIKALFRDLEKGLSIGELLHSLMPDAPIGAADIADMDLDSATKTAIECVLSIRVGQIDVDKKARKPRKPRSTSEEKSESPADTEAESTTDKRAGRSTKKKPPRNKGNEAADKAAE